MTATVHDVLTEALRLAEANPDFVYVPPVGRIGTLVSKTCRYVHSGAGSCLFGQALINVGVPYSRVATHEGDGILAVVRSLIQSGDIVLDEVQPRTINRLSLASRAQTLQDQRHPWRDTVPLLKQAVA